MNDGHRHRGSNEDLLLRYATGIRPQNNPVMNQSHEKLYKGSPFRAQKFDPAGAPSQGEESRVGKGREASIRGQMHDRAVLAAVHPEKSCGGWKLASLSMKG
jgi:hypothetical protein